MGCEVDVKFFLSNLLTLVITLTFVQMLLTSEDAEMCKELKY